MQAFQRKHIGTARGNTLGHESADGLMGCKSLVLDMAIGRGGLSCMQYFVFSVSIDFSFTLS